MESIGTFTKDTAELMLLVLAPRRVFCYMSGPSVEGGRQFSDCQSQKPVRRHRSAQSYPVGNAKGRRVSDPFLRRRHVWQNCRNHCLGYREETLQREGNRVLSKIWEAQWSMLGMTCFWIPALGCLLLYWCLVDYEHSKLISTDNSMYLCF